MSTGSTRQDGEDDSQRCHLRSNAIHERVNLWRTQIIKETIHGRVKPNAIHERANPWRRQKYERDSP